MSTAATCPIDGTVHTEHHAHSLDEVLRYFGFTREDLMTTFDPRCTQQTYPHHCDERCWPDLSPYDIGEYVEDATGRLFQRIGTDDDPHPWRYLTDRDHPTSYPSSVSDDDLVRPITRLVRESDD